MLGKQIAECVDEIARHVKRGCGTNEEFQKTLDLLRSFPEYTRYASADFSFTFLPNEVTNDIVAFAVDESNSWKLLSKLDGPFGDFARNLSYVSVNFKYNQFTAVDRGPNGNTSKVLTLEEAKEGFINEFVITGDVDVDLLRAVAPILYETICIHRNYKDIPGDVYDLLGARFSEVQWWGRCQTADNNEIEFLKRQLRSKYLRLFSTNSDALQDDEFIDLLIEFVKKPSFEYLHCEHSTLKSPKLLMEAEKAWDARTSFQTRCQKIIWSYTGKYTKRLREYFQVPPRNQKFSRSVNHTVDSSAKKTFEVCGKSFQLEFSNGLSVD